MTELLQERLRDEIAELKHEVLLLRAERDSANTAKARARGEWCTLNGRTGPDIVLITDLNHRFLHANGALLAVWQKSLDQVIGSKRGDLGYPAAVAERLESEAERVIEGGAPVRSLHSFSGANGELRDYEYTFSPVFDGAGKVEAVSSRGRDITEASYLQNSLLMFRQLAAQSTDFIGMADPDGRCFYVNEAGRSLAGLLDMDAVQRCRVSDFFYEKDRAFLNETILASVLSKGSWVGEMNFRHFVTGEPIPMLYNIYPIRDATGQILSFATISRDLRDSKKDFNTLRISEQRLSFALDLAGAVGFWELDLRSGYITTTEAFATLFSIDPARALEGVPASEYIASVHPADLKQVEQDISDSVEAAGEYTSEYRILQKDGSERWVQARGRSYNDADGHPLRMPGVLIDITDRKRKEVELEKARGAARTILESITDGVYVLDSEWCFTYTNPAGEKLLGARHEHLVGKNIWKEYPLSAGTLIESEYRRAVRDQVVVETDMPYPDWNRWFALRLYPTKEGGLSVYFRDITESKAAEQDLLDERLRFETALSYTPDHTYTFDKQGRCTYANRSLLMLLQKNLDEVIGKNFFELGYPVELAERWHRQIRKVVETGQPVRDYATFAGAGGESREYEYIFVPVLSEGGRVDAVAGSTRDMTEQRESDLLERDRQEQFREAARLQSLGVMAGGIAHDFNNLLVGVLGNASLLSETVEGEDRKLVSGIILAGTRAADLTKQMLTYSGGGSFLRETLDLNSVVHENLTLLRASLSRSVTVKLELFSEECFIEADRSQIQQIVMNLLLNASEATGDLPGTVVVRTSITTRRMPRFSPRLQTMLGPGKYVVFEVHDNGTGMAPETLSRIFDPFFSTKFTGRGLGLAAVLGIVKGHAGDIGVTSQPGVGTTFRVLLPACPRPIAQTPIDDPIGTGLPDHPVVLVVEDEEMVLRVAIAVLNSRGFRVLTARNGVEALEMLSSHAEISVVILDLTMPVMTGEQLIPLIQAAQPTLPIILSTGYSEAETSRRFEKAALAGFLLKPYSAQALISKVTEVLRAFPRVGLLRISQQPSSRVPTTSDLGISD